MPSAVLAGARKNTRESVIPPASLEGKDKSSFERDLGWQGRRKPWRAFADRSDDGGRTWAASAVVWPEKADHGMIQPTLWESAPGTVHMLCRSTKSDSARIWRSSSTDGGKTWSKPKPSALPNNNSGLDVALLPHSRTLVLVYNPTVTDRTPLRVSISEDNGHAWTLSIDLETEKGHVRAGHEYSYPAVIPWPATSREEGFSVFYTWHRKRMAFYSTSLREFKAQAQQSKIAAHPRS